MAVLSNTFGGLRLTGEDAQKFKAQTRNANKSDAAKGSARRGIAIARELSKNGRATVTADMD